MTDRDRALQALHDENERLGLYKDAYKQEQGEPVAIIRKALEQGAMLAVYHRRANPAAYQEQLDNLALQLSAEMPAHPAKQEQGEPVAWPEHEFIQWGAQKYGPLVRAAINLLAEIDSNHDSKSYPQKYGVPYGAVNTLRDALSSTPQQRKPLDESLVGTLLYLFQEWKEDHLSQSNYIDCIEGIKAAHGIKE